MPAVKKVVDNGSSRKYNPIRNFNTAMAVGNISYESLRHKVENMKETALELKEKLSVCERTMTNVEDGMERIQERVRQLQK